MMGSWTAECAAGDCLFLRKPTGGLISPSPCCGTVLVVEGPWLLCPHDSGQSVLKKKIAEESALIRSFQWHGWGHIAGRSKPAPTTFWQTPDTFVSRAAYRGLMEGANGDQFYARLLCLRRPFTQYTG